MATLFSAYSDGFEEKFEKRHLKKDSTTHLKVPDKPEDVTLHWLKAIFKPHGITVHSFTFTGDASNGRGYMGTLEKVELQISRPLNNNDEDKQSDYTETLHIILKTLPKDPFCKSTAVNGGFSSKEVKMYTEVFPTWQKFLDSRQVPSAHRFRQPICYYGAEEGEGDSYKCVLVLENLIAPSLVPTYHLWKGGFTDPLPWLQTSAVIRQLARFHATGIAYQVENHIDYNQLFPKVNYAIALKDPPFQVYWDTGFKIAKEVIRATMEKQEIPNGIFEQLDVLQGDENRDVMLMWCTEPSVIPGFKTISHDDLHSNNLVLSEDNTMAILFDYQTCKISNPMKDLSFFLILNCHSEDSIKNLPRALQLYHDEFAATMAAMTVDLTYSMEEMKRDYDKHLALSIAHIMTAAPIWITGPGSTFETKRNYANVVVDAFKRGLLKFPKVEERFIKEINK